MSVPGTVKRSTGTEDSAAAEVAMAEAYIAGAVRTARGRRNGGLSAVPPLDLPAHAPRPLVRARWRCKRAEPEELASQSQQPAGRAIDEGRLEGEIVPQSGVSTDEGPRGDTSLEKMPGLGPLRDVWEITAATASQISDGAS